MEITLQYFDGCPNWEALDQRLAQVVDGLSRNGEEGDGQIEERVRAQVEELCQSFPVYPGM